MLTTPRRTPRRIQRCAPTLAAPVVALAMLLSACAADDTTADPTADAAGPATAVTVTDAQNRTVEVPGNPEVVVAMDWSVIRTLTDLGVEVDAVPTPSSDLPEDLKKYADDSIPKVGTVFEPDYEAINALEPDLVVVGSRSGNAEVVAEMEKITPAVIDMSVRPKEVADTITQTQERVVDLASIFGKQAEATARMDAITADLAAVKAQAAAVGSTMFVQVSGGKASAYGPGSRFGLLYDQLGFAATKAPVDNEGSHGQEVSQEFFSQYNPGVIFVLDRGKTVGEDGSAALDVLNNDLVNGTDAAKAKKIVEVDGFAWYLATAAPSSLEQMVADAKKAL